VAQFTLAVDRPFLNQAGEREADFIPIVAWQRLAETCANHLHKGRLVAVEGRLQIRSYEAQDGQRRRVAEVVAGNVQFLDRASDSRRAGDVDTGGMDPGEPIDEENVEEINLDDLPF
jgi:single-strand DNA-binding protein